LSQAAVHLAFDEQRVEDGVGVVDADIAQEAAAPCGMCTRRTAGAR
jgi:hypothetical protein